MECEFFGTPQPLPDPLPQVEPFDPLFLPEALQGWIHDISERMQCPIDFPAVAAMVSVAEVIGRKVGIRPKRHDDWLVVPNLWGAVIGRPGVLKTPAILEPLRQLYRLEAGAKDLYQQLMDEWKVQQIVAKEQEKVTAQKIRETLKKDGDATAIAETMLAVEGRQPTRTRYLVNDSTVEKLGELLHENPNGLLVFRDELTGLLRQLDREGHESDRAFYLEAWNGNERFTYDRIGRGTIDIEACCVSILGGIQPGPLGRYLRSALQGGEGDDGLLQRFQLLVWPDITTEWRNVDRWPNGDDRQRAYLVFTRLNGLTFSEIDAVCDEDHGGIPYVRFSDEAQAVFDEWRSALEHRLRQGREHPAIEAHLAKYRSLIPSLALLIHLADGGKHPVGVDALERACAWGDYLESHARRVYSQGIAPDDMAARELAARIQAGDLTSGFTARDVYRRHWAGLSTREEAEKAIAVLIELGWLHEVKESTGGRPSAKYLINPGVSEVAR
jgi:putative DNA primase/helicase